MNEMHTRSFVLFFAAILLLVRGMQPVSAQMPPENVRLFAYSLESNLIAIGVDVPGIINDLTLTLVEVYDSVSGNYLGFISPQEAGLTYLQFNATGDRLTTVTVDNHVVTWDISSFTRTEPSLPGGVFEAGPIAWNPHDNRLAASLARQVYISNADSPDVTIFGDEETTSTLTDMGWSPDGNNLAISTYDVRTETQQVTIWDASGDPRPTEPILRIVGNSTGLLDWKPDGTALAASTVDGVVIYDAVTGETIQRLQTDQGTGYMYEVRWSPDGRQIAAGFQWDLWIWDVATNAAVAHYTMPQPVEDIAWLPTGQVLHNGGEIGLAINGSSIEGYALPYVPSTPTPVFTPMLTVSSTSTATFTPTSTFTQTPTETPTASFTPTPIHTSTYTLTFTSTLTATFTPTFTPTSTFTSTATATFTSTATFIPTFTPTPSVTCTAIAANPSALVNAITAASDRQNGRRGNPCSTARMSPRPTTPPSKPYATPSSTAK